jgi:hypothetical protein
MKKIKKITIVWVSPFGSLATYLAQSGHDVTV